MSTERGHSLTLYRVRLWTHKVTHGLSPPLGLPRRLSRNRPASQHTHGFHLWVGKIPWRRNWPPTPGFLLGNPVDGGAWWATYTLCYKRVGPDLMTKQQHSCHLHDSRKGRTPVTKAGQWLPGEGCGGDFVGMQEFYSGGGSYGEHLLSCVCVRSGRNYRQVLFS